MANEIYKIDETVTTWQDASGTLGMTLNNLPNGDARQGAVLDLGAGTTARPNRFNVRVTVQFITAPAVGEYVELLLRRGDSTNRDNALATTDLAIAAADLPKLRNCMRVGRIYVTEATADVSMSRSFIITLDEREVMPVLVNYASVNLRDENNFSNIVLTEMPYQGQ